MSASEGENSDTSEWLPFPTPKYNKNLKRDRQSSSEEAMNKPRKKATGIAEQEPEDPDSLEEYLADPNIETPPPSKSARKLSSAIELARGMREMTTADMVTLIINKAKTSEKTAARNLKGNFKRYIREIAGMQKAAATELTKKINVSSDAARLEQENIQLRVRLHELEERLERMEKAQEGKNRNRPRERREEKHK